MVLANHRDMGHHRCISEDDVKFFIESLNRFEIILFLLRLFF